MSILLRLLIPCWVCTVPRGHSLSFALSLVMMYFSPEVKASSAELLWVLQGCYGAAAEVSFAAHMVEVAEVPAVSAGASSKKKVRRKLWLMTLVHWYFHLKWLSNSLTAESIDATWQINHCGYAGKLPESVHIQAAACFAIISLQPLYQLSVLPWM